MIELAKNVKDLELLDGYEQIIKQIYFLEEQILEDKGLFNKDCFLTIQYKEIGSMFENILEKCQSFIGIKERDSFQISGIKTDERMLLEEREFEKICKEKDKLDWRSYRIE